MDKPVRFSRLKSMARSPMHYQYELKHEREDTKALRLGRALDARIFGTTPVACFDGQRRGKEWAAFAQANAGAICLNNGEAAQVNGMYESIMRRQDALDLLEGERQQVLHWSLSGRACQGTPDAFTDYRIVELKTCRTSDPNRFVWDARRFGWNAQLSWYQEGLLQSGRPRPDTAYIVAVESIAPHPVTVFVLTDRALDQGNRTWRLWFERLRACEESDAWPAYVEQAVLFDVPEEDNGLSLLIGGEEVEV